MRAAALLALSVLFVSGSLAAQDTFPSAKNASAIAGAIRNGADLKATGLAQLLFDDELAALESFAGCNGSLREAVTKNLAMYDWDCEAKVAGGPEDIALQQTVTMRFRDDGSLFALAINPRRESLAPTAQGAALSRWPARKATAQSFAEAVSTGGDPTLGGLIPLTPLQRGQLRRLADSNWRLEKYMSASDKAQARRIIGAGAKFAEAPKDGVEMLFSSRKPDGPKDKFATLYFDEANRAIGLSMEDSMLAFATVSELSTKTVAWRFAEAVKAAAIPRLQAPHPSTPSKRQSWPSCLGANSVAPRSARSCARFSYGTARGTTTRPTCFSAMGAPSRSISPQSSGGRTDG